MKRPALGTILGATACLLALGTSGLPADAASLINGKNIKPSSITGQQIKDHSLTAADLATGLGVAGPQGPPGPQGVPGTSSSGTPDPLHTIADHGTADACAGITPVAGVFCGVNGNGWRNVYVATGWRAAAYTKSADGDVTLEGVVGTDGSPSNSVFILPPGYRPSKAVMTAGVCGDSSGYPTITRVDISASGLVALSGFEKCDPATSYVALGGLTFRAEQ